MKKVLIGAMIILSLGVVGCTTKERNITLENYSNRVNENNDVVECIEIKIDSEKISKESVNKIIEIVGRKDMDTEIAILNSNGDKIGDVKESGDKTNINIGEEFTDTKNSEVIFNDSDKLKEAISNSNEEIISVIMPRITEMMELYNQMVDATDAFIGEDIKEANLIVLVNMINEITSKVDIKEIEDKAKYITDNDKFTKAFDVFKSTTDSHNNMIDKAKEFTISPSTETLTSFKSEILQFRANVARYSIQIDNLDGSDLSLTEQIN